MSVTIVTGLWDIGRSDLNYGWSRPFEDYLDRFSNLLKTPDQMIIYIQEKYESFVWAHRSRENTKVIIREVDWFKSNESIYNKIQEIIKNSDWYSQSSWLYESPQAKLEWYNPLVMSKMFLLNDARILDPFDSTHLVWIDAGITNTVHGGYFWHDKTISKLEKYFDNFSFVCFPYGGKVEIHGFSYESMCNYAQGTVDKVARGGVFGGPKDSISKANEVYYELLQTTLNDGYMGTEESVFTIMLYKYPELFQYYEIKEDGLINYFFENLKNNNLQAKREFKESVSEKKPSECNVALYVIGFNFPNQFKTLCKSFELYDKNFLEKPKKYLLNNSTDITTDKDFSELCKEYGFEEIRKNNIGICGGRQFCAEHSEKNNFDYHLFFEDDMFFYTGKDQYCRNGFRRHIPNLYNIMIEIMFLENFDFLKFNFTEFFGDNRKQWSWHNVPADVRAKLFLENPVKEDDDVEKAPFLEYNNIKSYKGVPYATGKVYYCNWPQIVSKEGNKKMFLDTKWAHPYEQTWMSYIYQETVKGRINPGLFLATPTEHNRFEHYPAKERREN